MQQKQSHQNSASLQKPLRALDLGSNASHRDKTTINIYYQNVRSLCGKHKRFFCTSSSFDYDIIILTETWLKKDFNNAEYFDDTFNVHRKDRVHKRGGGVLIALNNVIFSSDEIEVPGAIDLEYVCIKAKAAQQNIYIYCAYIPPNSPATLYQRHLETISSISIAAEDNIIIVGDFNLPNIQWISDDDCDNIQIPSVYDPQSSAEFITGLMSIGLHQINSIRNKNNRLLDLIFTNDFINCSIDAAQELTKVDGHHPPILLTFEWHSRPKGTQRVEKSRNFARADYASMNASLQSTDFNALFRDKSLAQKVDSLHKVLTNVIERFVPLYIKKSTNKCPWNNKKLQMLKNKKTKEWKRYKRTGIKEQYDMAFDKFDKLNTSLYNAYVDKMKTSLKTDPSSFWRYVNSKKSTDNKPKTLTFRGDRTTDEQIQAKFFADFFGENFVDTQADSSQTQQPNTSQQNQTHDNNFQLNFDFVYEEMIGINTKKSTGPDGIHPLLLKHCASTLAAPLTEIFNESLATGIFPDAWKRSSVTPIFKKGARSNVENYRCIAKLQTIAKFFEHLINSKLLLLVRDKICDNQHGFLKNRSTASNLSEFVHYVQTGLQSGHQIDVLYTDFSKAFDRVVHHILFRKLTQFGLPTNLISWLKSYLSNRTQFVKYGCSSSADFSVPSGVPQGSHLGPTLFLLFINDIMKEMGEVMVLMYADDIKIAKIIKSTDDAATLQRAIDRLKLWCDQNMLHLNLDKCAVLTISKNKHVINTDYHFGSHIFKKVNEQKDLGVLIDSKLSFSKHIESITAKAIAALGFIKRFCYDISDVQTLKTLYYALVQSHLEYCCVAWLPFYDVHIKNIERVLRQFTMFALKEYPSEANQYIITPYKERLESLGMTSLHRRRINSSLVFLYDTINGNTGGSLVKHDLLLHTNNRNIRRTEVFRVADKKLKLALSIPISQMCKYANKVPEKFTNAVNRTSFITSIRNTDDTIFGVNF